MHAEDVERKPSSVARNSKTGDELIPQPSSDPRDPLVRWMPFHLVACWARNSADAEANAFPPGKQNWSEWKKAAVFATFCYSTFTGIATAVANNLALNVQAVDMDTTPVAMSYSVSSRGHRFHLSEQATNVLPLSQDLCRPSRHHCRPRSAHPSGPDVWRNVLLVLEHDWCRRNIHLVCPLYRAIQLHLVCRIKSHRGDLLWQRPNLYHGCPGRYVLSSPAR